MRLWNYVQYMATNEIEKPRRKTFDLAKLLAKFGVHAHIIYI